ncbi:MAG TPA: EAL domain-containing protein [Gammaproteobacteria bacterium]|nr:EAL domain-containing protein [Gammaproteobacteria bacterium]
MKYVNLSEESRTIFRGRPGHENKQAAFLSNLKNAIDTDKLSLHYQPRFDVVTGKADILEALVRWHRPGVGLFSPEVFISDAEENGLIFGLDLWVFERCCKDLKQMQESINPDVKIAVNLSVLTCESIYFAQKIINISNKHDVSLSDFEFEITEHAHIHDVRKVISFCETLKNYGAEFCLDDFGTGQSPLVNLTLLPASTVKIDRCFIQGIGNSRCCEIIIQSLVEMVQKLDMQIVAEGIENSEQYWFIRDSGCDQLQGFLLCKPVGIDSLKSPMLRSPEINYPDY